MNEMKIRVKTSHIVISILTGINAILCLISQICLKLTINFEVLAGYGIQ